MTVMKSFHFCRQQLKLSIFAKLRVGIEWPLAMLHGQNSLMFNPSYLLNEIERSNGATQYPQYGDELATEILNER